MEKNTIKTQHTKVEISNEFEELFDITKEARKYYPVDKIPNSKNKILPIKYLKLEKNFKHSVVTTVTALRREIH